MRSKRYDGPLGPNEMPVPSIVAPGGNLIYFVPAADRHRLFESDFALEQGTQDPATGGPALLNIDHIALGLGLDQLDTWVLFSRAVLGLEMGESLELADPFGLIRSRGVANAQRSVRLVLNVSLSERTRTAQAVRRRGAGSVQHIALRSDDIFASVQRLQSSGVRFVPISPNYYDDLPTRLELDDALLQRLRAAGILFDRSPTGDYLHIYSETLEEGIFFEIIQRVGGYDGYGATNAPARMASQAQMPITQASGS